MPTSSRAGPAHRAGVQEQSQSGTRQVHPARRMDSDPGATSLESPDTGPPVFINTAEPPPPPWLSQGPGKGWPRPQHASHRQQTHRQEYHAVHAKGGVSGVEGQPERERVVGVMWQCGEGSQRVYSVLSLQTPGPRLAPQGPGELYVKTRPALDALSPSLSNFLTMWSSLMGFKASPRSCFRP